eukprot:TRINITY_DN4513_c0_g2_i1.p2 TRINITY_DN4513_c0_g2~~TRINITY_DN4513_c0_g2_i1.p2  ORF type:complete len:204 (+),score=64.07 TRINITY_DN4513_c0_g2_i1:61-672(+)
MGASQGKAGGASPPPQAQPESGALPPVPEGLDDAPDPEQIGNAGWTILHTTAVAYPTKPSVAQQRRMWDFINSWSHVYPCGHCAAHMRLQLRKTPPLVESKESFTLWTCRLHNEVNARLGKDEFPCDFNTMMARWHPTYPEIEGTDQNGGMQDMPQFVAKARPAEGQAQAQQSSVDPDLQSLVDMQCSAFCPKDAKDKDGAAQ